VEGYKCLYNGILYGVCGVVFGRDKIKVKSISLEILERKNLSVCDRDELGCGEGVVFVVYYETMKRNLI
jgi:hypothetical protein